MIHIITYCTKSYNMYMSYLEKSLKNLFPNNDKIIHFISDINHDLDVLPCNVNNGGTIIVPDLPYAYCACAKPYYIKMVLDNCNDDDICLYFDADTIILEKDNIIWDNILTNMQKGILLSISPWITHKWFDTDIRHTHRAIKGTACYYPFDNKIPYVQTSFFGGKNQYIKKLICEIYHLTELDTKGDKLRRTLYVPPFFEETYINKIVYDFYQHKKTDINFIIDEYVINDYKNFYINGKNKEFKDMLNSDSTFIIQKFLKEIKEKQRDKV